MDNIKIRRVTICNQRINSIDIRNSLDGYGVVYIVDTGDNVQVRHTSNCSNVRYLRETTTYDIHVVYVSNSYNDRIKMAHYIRSRLLANDVQDSGLTY